MQGGRRTPAEATMLQISSVYHPGAIFQHRIPITLHNCCLINRLSREGKGLLVNASKIEELEKKTWRAVEGWVGEGVGGDSCHPHGSCSWRAICRILRLQLTRWMEDILRLYAWRKHACRASHKRNAHACLSCLLRVDTAVRDYDSPSPVPPRRMICTHTSWMNC